MALKAEVWVEAVTEGGRSSWPGGGKKRKTWPDIAREDETGKVAIAHGSVKFCEATPIGLADQS